MCGARAASKCLKALQRGASDGQAPTARLRSRATRPNRDGFVRFRFELGRVPANTKLSSNVAVRRVRVRGGNSKFRALRLDHGNFSWGSEVRRSKQNVQGSRQRALPERPSSWMPHTRTRQPPSGAGWA